jgi:hypothetical protein
LHAQPSKEQHYFSFPPCRVTIAVFIVPQSTLK